MDSGMEGLLTQLRGLVDEPGFMGSKTRTAVVHGVCTSEDLQRLLDAVMQDLSAESISVTLSGKVLSLTGEILKRMKHNLRAGKSEGKE